MNVDKLIQSRRSIRKYKTKAPSWKKILEAIDAAKYAPMAGDIFSLKFMLVYDPEKIKKIAKWSEQEFISQTSFVVLFLTDSSRTTNAYGKKGEKYCNQQAGAAMQNFVLKLTEEKLSTCWIGHFNEKMIKQTLRIPEDISIEAMFPIGYADEKPKEKIERELDNFIYFNQWGNNRMKPIEKLEGRMPEGYGLNIAKDI